jgi:hypothetical protein
VLVVGENGFLLLGPGAGGGLLLLVLDPLSPLDFRSKEKGFEQWKGADVKIVRTTEPDSDTS